MRLNQVTISVDNMDSAIAFYESIGLTLIVHTHGGYARFECPDGGSTFSLHLGKPPSAGSASIYFEVDDVTDTVRQLMDKGISFDAPPTEQSWLWHEAWLRDPAGNRICIYHAGRNRRFPPWRKA